MSTNLNLDQLSINNIRVLCSEMIDKAKSGQPGMAIGAAPIMHTLFTRFLFLGSKAKQNLWRYRNRQNKNKQQKF